MIHEKIWINIEKEKVRLPYGYDSKYWKEKLSIDSHHASIKTYVIENSEEIDAKRQRPAVLICPGGGYGFKSKREAESVAIAMNARGFQAFILDYSVEPAVFPQALLQVAKAVSVIRENAKAWYLNPDKIIIGGFSAGGHLAASHGVYYHEQWLLDSLELSVEDLRPNGLLLSYPVILSNEFAHEGSMINLFGNEEKINWDFGGLDKHVSAKVPSTFLWHTFEDASVPVENALEFARALRKYDVAFDLHVFQKGGHGLSLATEETAHPGNPNIEKSCQPWIDLFATWVAEQN
jgi:acetyl esterase/lipase